MPTDLQTKTIADFGKQWTTYTDNEGYYGSVDLLYDIFGPLIKAEEYRGRRVAEIGAGTGRIIRMLLEAGAGFAVAVEPSDAFPVLVNNLEDEHRRIECLNCTGDQMPAYGDLDYVFSVGVLHHIPDPRPVVRAAFDALKPGGQLAAWLYGKEGNGLYLGLVRPLRMVTTRLPHAVQAAIAWMLYWPLACYIGLCKLLPLPLRGYMNHVIGPMTPAKRRLVIYDQLNPAYAKYYTRAEATALLKDSGFTDIRLYHRHGYSWSVIGSKPE